MTFTAEDVFPPLFRHFGSISNTKMKCCNHPHLRIASPYMQLGLWSIILSLVFVKLAKIDFELTQSAKINLDQGYNCTEK